MAVLTETQADAAVRKLKGEEVQDVDAPPSDEQIGLGAALACCLVWPCIVVLPLVLTLGGDTCGYQALFPRSWYDEEPVQPARGEYGVADPRAVKPLGLTLGIVAVALGQVFVLIYHWLRRNRFLGSLRPVQAKAREPYNFVQGMVSHLSQPEGFGLIGGYLVGTWMLGLMPASYYSFAGGIRWHYVLAQLLLQDCLQMLMHLGEHKIHPAIYKHSHKSHHRNTNPRLFDAFDGSMADTTLMIIVPFLVVARVVPANVWEYMTFGSLYANWLCLIHSEFVHPWDWVFRRLGLGTAWDHHVHHRLFVFNYGHLFSYWDRLAGTYRDAVGPHFDRKEK
jgi:sterol desaturase/sphingolipid hydroxylase (fatty acid hydroxylase superfamily)